jgi:hypothetical protein
MNTWGRREEDKVTKGLTEGANVVRDEDKILFPLNYTRPSLLTVIKLERNLLIHLFIFHSDY